MNKRIGDTIKINGEYQYRALTEGNPVQRFWHLNKQIVINRMMPPEASDSILDVGCGSGVITSFLGKSGASVLGIDGNGDAIAFATERYSASNVKFTQNLVDNDFQMDSLIDKIYCLEVIEHIYYDQAKVMLAYFYKLLKPGGKVFLTTPNYRSLWPAIEFLMDLLSKTPPLGEHQHVEFYNKEKLRKICMDSCFTVESIATSCLLAPWIAPINWKSALKADEFEVKLSSDYGSILNFVLVKQG